MNHSLVNSRDNPLVRTLRLVAEQSRRAPAGLVLAEGLRVIEEAAAAGCRFHAVLVEEGFGSEPRQRTLLEYWKDREIPVRLGGSALMKSLSDVISHQGALALIDVPALTLAQVPEVAPALLLCLCGTQDPGNVGTLLRTARAAGAGTVCTTAGTVSARNPKAIRASAGAFFRLPVVEGLQPADICAYCSARRIPMYLANARGKRSCWEVDLKKPAAILLGNEARGFAAGEWTDAVPLRIPMRPGVESLNVAAAGAVLLFEALRQRSAGDAHD